MTTAEYARQKHIREVQSRYSRLMSEKRCTQCGKQDDRTLAGRTRCNECNAKTYVPRENRSERQLLNEKRRRQEIRQERVEAGLCRECGKEDYLTLRGSHVCVACKRIHKEAAKRYAESGKKAIYRKRRKEELIAEGKCIKCGRNPVETGRKQCTDCLVWERLYRRKRRAIIQGLGV